jgi:hypothetical protein
MKEKTKKATFNISTRVLEELDSIMTRGVAPSKNALVEQALVKELKDIRKQIRQKEWEKAAGDPLFTRDIEDTKNAFESADAETARRIG